jgi:hypothetical protein
MSVAIKNATGVNRGCRNVLQLAFIVVLEVLLAVQTPAQDFDASIKHHDVKDTPKNRFVYKNGYIQYKPQYTLFVYPPFYTLPVKNKYIRDIFSSILLDQLQLNKVVYVKDPAPVAIFYPDNILQEDPYKSYMTGELPAPEHFDFQAKMIYDFPPAIMKEPEKMLTDPDLSRFFLPEDMYLVSSMEQVTENQHEMFTFQVQIYRNGKLLFKNKVSTNEADISKNLIVFAREISTHITGARTGSLMIKSDIEKASVYINERYMGYTPLFIENAVIGKNTVSVRKEGYGAWQRQILIEDDKKTEITAVLEKIKSENRVTIISTPEKCDVFFDVDYKGQTPLIIENVTNGIHRVQIQKEGFIDSFKTIFVNADKQEYEVSTQLDPGKTKEYYNINRPVIGSLSYEQLFKISALVTTISGLSGLFSQIQQENLQIDLNRYLDDHGNDDPGLISKQQSNIDVYKGLKTGFYIGGGVFLAITLYFFIKYIGIQDMPIAGLTSGQDNGNRVFLSLNPEQNAFQFIFQHRL